MLLETAKVGSRVATRVRITHGAFAGQKGMVVRVYHPGAIRVRFTSPGRYHGRALDFGESELEVLD